MSEGRGGHKGRVGGKERGQSEGGGEVKREEVKWREKLECKEER